MNNIIIAAFVNADDQNVTPGKPTPTPAPPPVVCEQTKTLVNGRQSCQGQLIFEEDFNNIDASKWQHDVRIANSPVSH